MLVDEELQRFGVVRRQAKPQGRPLGDLQADLAMVLQETLAQVVNQQGQMEHSLIGDAAVDAPQRPGVADQLGGELDRPKAMLVHRVLVILVELQESAGAGEFGNESLQDGGVVQIAKQRAEPARMRQQREEAAARLRRRLADEARAPGGG